MPGLLALLLLGAISLALIAVTLFTIRRTRRTQDGADLGNPPDSEGDLSPNQEPKRLSYAEVAEARRRARAEELALETAASSGQVVREHHLPGALPGRVKGLFDRGHHPAAVEPDQASPAEDTLLPQAEVADSTPPDLTEPTEDTTPKPPKRRALPNLKVPKLRTGKASLDSTLDTADTTPSANVSVAQTAAAAKRAEAEALAQASAHSQEIKEATRELNPKGLFRRTRTTPPPGAQDKAAEAEARAEIELVNAQADVAAMSQDTRTEQSSRDQRMVLGRRLAQVELLAQARATQAEAARRAQAAVQEPTEAEPEETDHAPAPAASTPSEQPVENYRVIAFEEFGLPEDLPVLTRS